jgi:TonB family protein
MIPWSIGLHVGVVVVAAVVQAFSSARTLPPPAYEVTLLAPIKKGTPGGGVAPASTPSTTSVAPVPTPVVKATDGMSLPDPHANDARNDALERLKREEALKRIAALSHSQPNAGSTPGPTPTPGSGSASDPKGDGGSEYGVWGGIPGSATYEQQVQAIVTQNWVTPVWLSADKPLQCVIRVFIGFDGKIASMQVESSSGDPRFDETAQFALRKSDPLPPAPLDAKQYVLHKGLPMRFDSRTKLAATGGNP